jgi:Fe(3+) dicitrate transport protein
VTLFYIDFDDELQYISNDVGWTNLGATKHQGIEASVHYDLAALDPRLDGLSVNAGFTYTRATYEGDIPGFKGRDLPFYSRQVATAGLRYDINRWTYNLDGLPSPNSAPGHRHECRQQLQRRPEPADGQYGDIPGYMTWNVRGGWV